MTESEKIRKVERQFLPGGSPVRAGRTTRMPDVHIRHLDGANWTIPQVYPSKYTQVLYHRESDLAILSSPVKNNNVPFVI